MNINIAYDLIMPPTTMSYIAMSMWTCVLIFYFISNFTIKYVRCSQLIISIYDDLYKKLKVITNGLIPIIIFFSLFAYVFNSFGYKRYSFVLILFIHGCILPFYVLVVLLIKWLNIAVEKDGL